MSALVANDYGGAMTMESMNHVDPDIAAGLAILRRVAERSADVVDAGLPFIRDAAARAGLRFD